MNTVELQNKTDNKDVKEEKKEEEKPVDSGKEYRKKYYLKNREAILQRKTERKQRNVLDIAQSQIVKLHEITEKLNKIRYQPVDEKGRQLIDGRTRLATIKNDYKVLKALFKDKEAVAYNEGIFQIWLVKIDSLIKKHVALMTDAILKNFLGL